MLNYYLGIRGFANLEECAIGAVHSLDAFNFLSGVLFLIVFVTVSLVAYFKIKYDFNESITLSKPAYVLHYLMVVLLIISIIMGFCDIVYSFYIASQVYGQFDEFRQGQVNCSSSVYYSSFVSVMIVFNYTFVVFGLAVFLYFTFHHIVNIRSQNSIQEN
jgi:hypothetical protein